MIAISIQEQMDPPIAIKEMRKRHHLTYPILSDQKATILEKFGFSGIPSNVILDKKGKYVANPETIDEMVKKLNQLAKK